MNPIGFTFRNKHSSTFGVGVRSDDRTVIPELRKNEFIIPGRHGTIDFGLNTYNPRVITLEIGVFGNLNHHDLRLKARALAAWLSGKGRLIFDDEPEKAYEASVYSSVGIDQIELAPYGIIKVGFECQPFAESVEYNQIGTITTTIPKELKVDNRGTTETCCQIRIKNIGSTVINKISIKRKGEVV